MNAVNKAPMVATETEAEAQVTQEARPPGNRSEESTSTGTAKKIFVCSPYRPLSETEESRKTELEANLHRARTACRILSTLGFMPLAPHLYFTTFLNDGDKKERADGIRFGMRWLEEADEVWVFGGTISEGMAAEIAKAKELGKTVRSLPEPGRMVELLLKMITENYHVPKNKKTEGQHKAAESEDNDGNEE